MFAPTPLSVACSRHDDIRHFAGQLALPAGQTLALHTRLGTLCYLASGEGYPRLLMQAQFTSTEMSILMSLLESYPTYCPYEAMYSYFYRHSMAEKVVASARKHLQEAHDAGTWEDEMRPVRQALSRARSKLRAFGIDIAPILTTGYLLFFL